VNEDEHGVCEVFSHLGKSGGCASSQAEAVSRLVSLSLRSGVDADQVAKQLTGIQCPNSIWFKGNKILSCPDGISWALRQYIQEKKNREPELVLDFDGTHKNDPEEPKPPHNPVEESNVAIGACPDCGRQLTRQEGCLSCICGYSKCS
jgi:ribonucleoside-diphosphate reductase alpha chain